MLVSSGRGPLGDCHGWVRLKVQERQRSSPSANASQKTGTRRRSARSRKRGLSRGGAGALACRTSKESKIGPHYHERVLTRARATCHRPPPGLTPEHKVYRIGRSETHLLHGQDPQCPSDLRAHARHHPLPNLHPAALARPQPLQDTPRSHRATTVQMRPVLNPSLVFTSSLEKCNTML